MKRRLGLKRAMRTPRSGPIEFPLFFALEQRCYANRNLDVITASSLIRRLHIFSRCLDALLLVAAICLIASCAANPLIPSARTARIVTTEPTGCDYLGEVSGNQGDFFTWRFTSKADLETGVRNDFKNQAARPGGNTVHLLTTHSADTSSFGVGRGSGGGSSAQTNVVYVGTVYRCSEFLSGKSSVSASAAKL